MLENTSDKSDTVDPHQIIALLLAFFAFFMAAFISRHTFERLPHLEDEMAYVFQARVFARGNIVIDTPEPRQAYWQPFVIDYNETGHRFGKYTPGWPLLLSLGVNMGQMWIINAFCGMVTVALVYRLGREVYDPDVGVAAAALTAFSPMALLLNATLMGHTSALCFFTLFMYAYWRIERALRTGRQGSAWRWGILAGVGLGLAVINRPLTAIGVAFPFLLWSGWRVLRDLWDWQTGKPFPFDTGHPFVNTLRPFAVIAAITLVIALAWPLYNYAAAGDATRNLYTLVWPYDQVGFGECCGRDSGCRSTCGADCGHCGHTIVKGIRQTRWDLSLTAADLFGWQAEKTDTIDLGLFTLPVLKPGTITPEIEDHLRLESDDYPLIGLSFFILPLGLWVGFKNWRLRVWLVIGLLWLVVPLARNMDFLNGDPYVNGQPTTGGAWRWLAFGAGWMLIPPIILHRIRKHAAKIPSPWTWLFLGVVVGLIGTHLGYWIGSQRYSTRYYFEALTALAIIGALPVAWLARRIDRGIVYPIFAALLLWSLFDYSFPRIHALYRFNHINPEIVEAVDEHRQYPNIPALVIVTGGREDNVMWRSFGTLMAVTSPYLDSDIVVAWDFVPTASVRRQILARFPDREIIEMEAQGNRIRFRGEEDWY